MVHPAVVYHRIALSEGWCTVKERFPSLPMFLVSDVITEYLPVP